MEPKNMKWMRKREERFSLLFFGATGNYPKNIHGTRVTHVLRRPARRDETQIGSARLCTSYEKALDCERVCDNRKCIPAAEVCGVFDV
jgi:hypothetical protein